MNASDWIAVYAALVGTAALAWEATGNVLERRPNLGMQLTLVHLLGTDEQQRIAASEPAAIETPWQLQIDVVNRGRSTVKVGLVQIETNREESGIDVWTSTDWGLPWALEPGDQRAVSLRNEAVGGLLRGQELTARAMTTKGRSFCSETLRVAEKGSGRQLVAMPEEQVQALIDATGDEGRLFVHRLTEFGPPPDGDPGEHG